MDGFGVSELIGALFGALVAGGSRVIFDWRVRQMSRVAYLSCIKTEVKCLIDLMNSQELDSLIENYIYDCEKGVLPKHGIAYDFGYNYFSCYDSLGGDLKYLSAKECRAIVSFYMLVKAAFDTVKKGGPLSGSVELATLAQRFKFLKSILPQLDHLNMQIQAFEAKAWWFVAK